MTPLHDILSNRKWMRRAWPFPHVVARDVFVDGYYRELEQAFRDRLALGLCDGPSEHRFGRNTDGFDAYSADFRAPVSGPFEVFFSKAWHDMLASMFEVEATGHVSGGLHHHPPRSASGKIHNDLNPGWFAVSRKEDALVLADHQMCGYKTGRMRVARGQAREVVRAVAMIFYLNNQPWNIGDGGFTGLYPSAQSPVARPVSVVPPENNSLIAFECRPDSFHSFVGNNSSSRDSLILWLHRTKEQVVSRWGDSSIVYWDQRRVTT